MNQKIILIVTILAITAISIPLTINQIQPKIDSTIDIQTQDDLTKIVDELVDEMYTKEIFLSMKDVKRLTGLDMNQILLFPNKMDGWSSGEGTWHDGYSLDRNWKNGTRTYDVFLNDGTLLKSIRINDEPEKEILILLK